MTTTGTTPVDSMELDQLIEDYHDALNKYVHGDLEPALGFWSDREDVTLANPLVPVVRGPEAVAVAGRSAGSNFQEGGPLRFESVRTRYHEVSRVVTPELAYVVETERSEGRLPGRDEPVVVSLRTTLVFRREGGTWKIVHRHADPITSARPVESILQQ